MSKPILGRTKKRRERPSGSAVDYLLHHMLPRLRSHLQERNNLTQDELAYVVEKVAALKDEKLKTYIGTLIGWGDEERAELETFIAISVEVLKNTNKSKVEAAARLVEIRHLSQDGAHLFNPAQEDEHPDQPEGEVNEPD